MTIADAAKLPKEVRGKAHEELVALMSLINKEESKDSQKDKGSLTDRVSDLEREKQILNLNGNIVLRELDKAKELMQQLIANAPNIYSGTNIELQQKKMFAFQDAVNKAEQFISEMEEQNGSCTKPNI